MLFAVQGYAQRGRQDSRRGEHRTEQRSSRPASHNNRHRPQMDSRRTPPQGSRHGYHRDMRPRYEQRRPPQQHRPHYGYPPPRPVPHHGYSYYPHHCHFNQWSWYSWGGYNNRYICHRQYRDRYFDSMLGYYIWGAMNAPTRLDIGNMSFTRYNGRLQLKIGNSYSYLDLYAGQTISYIVGTTTVSVSTGRGYATIRFSDEFGNYAVYTL